MIAAMRASQSILAEPVAEAWKANLFLGFEKRASKTVLSEKRFDGPLVVQKPLYPEGEQVCHAIVLHPPAGIAGGDELTLQVRAGEKAQVLLTTPGAGKWYRSAGPLAKQMLQFNVEGVLEWLPRETIVFNGALAALECRIELSAGAKYFGWEVLCLGRSGSGERFDKGQIRIDTRVTREGKLLWFERGRIQGGGRLMASPAGLDGRSVCGTLLATLDSADKELVAKCREHAAVTVLPGLLIARYLGNSSEEAMRSFTRLWTLLRPAVAGREAIEPRIWST
jgi:urease accessory protein